MRPLLFFFGFLSAPVMADPIVLKGGDYEGALQPQVLLDCGATRIVFGRKDGSIFSTVGTQDGFAKPVKIATLQKPALGMHRGPRIVRAGETLVVSAISFESGDLLTWTSGDGAAWGGPVRANSLPKAAEEGLHAMAASGNHVAIAWLDDRNGKKELRGVVSEDSGKTWKTDTLLYKSPDGAICTCCAPSLAFSTDGKLTAMWRNDLAGCRDMYLAASPDGGRTLGPAAKLGQGTWKLNTCPMDGGGLAFGTGDKPVTVWRRETTLYTSMPGEPEQSLGEGRDAAITAAPSREPVIVCQTPAGITLRKPGAAVETLDPTGHAPAVTTDVTGKIVVAWEAADGGLKVDFR